MEIVVELTGLARQRMQSLIIFLCFFLFLVARILLARRVLLNECRFFSCLAPVVVRWCHWMETCDIQHKYILSARRVGEVVARVNKTMCVCACVVKHPHTQRNSNRETTLANHCWAYRNDLNLIKNGYAFNIIIWHKLERIENEDEGGHLFSCSACLSVCMCVCVCVQCDDRV